MVRFEWDFEKELANVAKHNVNFRTASKVFLDPNRRVFVDEKHSKNEVRYYCIGKVNDQILTVRFSYREGRIRIFGAGYWRKGKAYYEKEKKG